MFVDDTEIQSIIKIELDRQSLQSVLNNLEKWTVLLRFNTGV